MTFSNMVRKKFEIKIASDELTTASVVARPTPTAPSRLFSPLWQLIKTIRMREAKSFR